MIRKVLEIIKYNMKALIEFELIFKLLSLLIFTPIFLKSFTFIMKVTGFNYLTIENIFTFLFKPLTLVMLILLLLLMMVYVMFDITTIIVILDNAYHKKKITVRQAINFSLNKCKKIFKIRNISLAFLVLFLIPFLNIGLSSSFIATIKIPEFIVDFILHNKLLLVFCIMLVIFLIIVLLNWIYSLHYFVLEDKSFKEARKFSKNLSRKNHLKDVITIFLGQLAIFIIYMLFVFSGIILIVLFNKIFGSHILLKSIFSSIVGIFLALSFIFITLLSTPISYAGISVLYYFHKTEKKEKIKRIELEDDSKRFVVFRRIFNGLVVVGVVCGIIFTYGLYKGEYNLNVEYIRNVEVTAHRGASINYPENTMSAFNGAKVLGADFVELDLNQTKDGEIIVSHDSNLKRTSGIDKDIIDVTYDEIKEYDVGSFFNEKYKDERIPLFRDVVKWAKENGMKLNIELKPTGKEIDFEKKVVDIIREYDYYDKCVITSQVYEVLENIKKYDKDIKTVYVMSIAVGDITLLSEADNFSVEASNVNKALVSKVHNEGKEIYVWTVNNENNMLKMIDYNVDNIITDNISLAKDVVMRSKRSNLINEFVKFFESL